MNKPLNRCPFCKCKAEEFRTVDPLGYQILCTNKKCVAKTRIWNEYEDAVKEWNASFPNANEVCLGVNVEYYEGDPPRPRYDKPTLGVTPKFIWLEHRARELIDYISRLLDAPQPDIQDAFEATKELLSILSQRNSCKKDF